MINKKQRDFKMDFELLGYFERWNIYFWMQLADSCQ